ncbi:CapA family protein [Haloechinothrix sp. YIM 98757]|uniref:CapA family protein n=1 Tax=Haloechinothrix aidingensis TaxID=2752311 RepID=A0A837ZVH8_9PSEU|nr:CapA family protein [Haloechinothrix aidingensis]MBA0124094.1 CapA family protein [Haloechinothrix aidingensis]
MRRRVRPALALSCAVLLGACTTTLGDAAPEPAEPDREGSQQAPDDRTGRPDSITVLGTGDILLHPDLTEQAARDASTTGRGERDFRPLLAGVEPLVSDADLAICHLEVPLAEQGGPFSGWPSFNAPPEIADALAATGYDTCSTASNHTLDQGEDGVVRTLDALDGNGIEHAGSARTEQEAASPTVIDVDGVGVAHLSYTFGFNGLQLPQGKEWLADKLDHEAIVEEAALARENGAEIVVASLHWGREYEHVPSPAQRELAERLLEAGAVDLILGHHAHVVQSIDRVGERWVAYGLGNHVARHAEPRGTTEEGIAARFEFTHTDDGWVAETAEYIPTLVDLDEPIRLVDLTTADPTPRREEALERTDGAVLGDGAAAHGLTRPGRE